MKHKFLLIISLLLYVYGQGQNFSVIKNGNRTSNAQGIAAPSTLVDGDSIIYSATRTNRSLVNLCLRKFDRTGATIDSAFFDFSYLSGFTHLRQNALKQADVKKFLLVDFIDSSHAYTNLIGFNRGLDTSLHVTLEDSTWDVFGYDFLVEDSTITVVCQLNRHLYNDQQLLIAQFDTALNPLWQSTIPDWRGQQGGYFPARIMRLHDAYYVVGQCNYPNWAEAFLDKIDLNGNLIWDKRYRIGNSNAGAVDVLALTDTLMLMINNNSSSSYDINMWLLKIDTSGVTLADTVYPTIEFFQSRNIIQAQDGNFVIAGYYDNNSTYNANGILFKIDRNFNILWQRSYVHKSSYDENRLWRIHQWPDGNLLATGSLEWWDNRPPNVPHDHVWLLSLDSNGCLAPNNCGVLSMPEEPWPEKETGFLVYPNPAEDELNLYVPELNGQTRLFLYTMQGQMVHHQTLDFKQGLFRLQLPANLPKASYLLKLKTETGEYNRKLIVH